MYEYDVYIDDVYEDDVYIDDVYIDDVYKVWTAILCIEVRAHWWMKTSNISSSPWCTHRG